MSHTKVFSQRLISLDAFRGTVVVLMLLVNNAGSDATYRQLEHAQWNGWTLTDTVFPSFLWIVGLAITLSLLRRLEAGESRRQLFIHVCRRAVILYVLGLLVYAFPDFELAHLRILGVLQRIAICYFVGSTLCLVTRWRGQILWIVGLLTIYWLVMMLIPVPGYGAGNLTVEGNFAHFVDRIVLGQHNLQETATWDPEGIISTLPAIATMLLGLMAGHIMRSKTSLNRRIIWLLYAGAALLVAGQVCSVWLPINKKLWTDSFTLFMAGLDFAAFASFVWVMDELKIRCGIQPLVVFGMNAITVYLCAELLSTTLEVVRVGNSSAHSWIFQRIFAGLGSPATTSLYFALTFAGAMYLVAYALYRCGLFLRA